MPLRPLAKTVAEPHWCSHCPTTHLGLPLTTQKGIFNMKSAMIVKAAVVAAVVALAGCTDLKPLQAQAANTAAAGAQSTANQALAAAQAAQAAVDATNEKIDRMFKRSISK